MDRPYAGSPARLVRPGIHAPVRKEPRHTRGPDLTGQGLSEFDTADRRSVTLGEDDNPFARILLLASSRTFVYEGIVGFRKEIIGNPPRLDRETELPPQL